MWPIFSLGALSSWSCATGPDPIGAIALPALPGGPAAPLPAVGLDSEGGVWLSGETGAVRVDPRRDPQQDLLLPELAAALAPLRIAAAQAREAPRLAIAADGRAPYLDVVRILYTAAHGSFETFELRVRTPDGTGAIPWSTPPFCGALARAAPSEPSPEPPEVAPEGDEREPLRARALLEMLGSTPACTAAWVIRGERDIEVYRVSVPANGDGCSLYPVPTDREPARLPSAAALAEHLAAEPSPPCASAWVAPHADTPWEEALALLVATRSRHDGATLAVIPEPP